MQLLYFAWVRERIGVADERRPLPADVATAGALLDWLKGEGEGYQAALADRGKIRIAINQRHAGWDDRVRDSDEVALFPPVTGG